MKLAKKAENPFLDSDPRTWGRSNDWPRRIEMMVDDGVIDQAWGCMFYRFIKKWKLDDKLDHTPHRRAGDSYHQLMLDYERWMGVDPDTRPDRELVLKRVKNIKHDVKSIRDALKPWRINILDSLIIRNEWVCGEMEVKIVKDCLKLLTVFFRTK